MRLSAYSIVSPPDARKTIVVDEPIGSLIPMMTAVIEFPKSIVHFLRMQERNPESHTNGLITIPAAAAFTRQNQRV